MAINICCDSSEANHLAIPNRLRTYAGQQTDVSAQQIKTTHNAKCPRPTWTWPWLVALAAGRNRWLCPS